MSRMFHTSSAHIRSNFTGHDGRPVNCIGVVPDAIDSFAGAYGAASFYCGGSLTHRDQFGRTSNVYNIDVSAQYAFNLGEIGEVVVRADVFNVFNFDDEVEVSEVGELGDGSPCPQFLMDNYYQLPRYLQLSLSYRL